MDNLKSCDCLRPLLQPPAEDQEEEEEFGEEIYDIVPEELKEPIKEEGEEEGEEPDDIYDIPQGTQALIPFAVLKLSLIMSTLIWVHGRICKSSHSLGCTWRG